MDDLYNIDLFHQNFSIEGVDCKLFSQFFIQVKHRYYANILLLCSKEDTKNLFLVALDTHNRKLVPIPVRILRTIIRAIKQIPFNDEYQEIINALPIINYELISKSKQIYLTQNFSALVNSTSMILKETKIELELLEGNRLTPIDFVFAAFDGINTSTYFVLENEYISKNKNWGVLSKICFYINGNYSGEYYSLSNHILGEKHTAFLCKTKQYLVLNRGKTSGIHMAGINIYEISDFIISSAGLFNSVAIPEDYLRQQKWLTIVIPVKGLQLFQEFGIGSVEFCSRQNSEIQRVINFDKRFNEFDTFALVHINREKMFSAYLAAKRQMEQSIDLVVNVLKDDCIFSLHSLGESLCERNIKLFEKKVILSTLTYIESPQTNARLSYDLAEPEDSKDLLINEQFLDQKFELEKIELLLIKANGSNNENITPLFNSLKWIRKAWDTNDFEDKIINAVIALEFIVSKEENVALVDTPTRKKCGLVIEQVINEIEADIPDKKKYLKTVLETFNRAVTETPFKVKLENLIHRLNIPVTNYEMELFVKARKQRNDIVHGRNETLLPTDDIYILCESISKIAFYKLNSLEDNLK